MLKTKRCNSIGLIKSLTSKPFLYPYYFYDTFKLKDFLPLAFAEEFSRTYDANGNLQTNGKRFYKYNSMNQLVSVYNGTSENSEQLLETYKWHPSDERIVLKKVYNKGVLNYTVYYPFENYVHGT
jgi:uncharacterized SAM-dependent methyltransferase